MSEGEINEWSESLQEKRVSLEKESCADVDSRALVCFKKKHKTTPLGVKKVTFWCYDT